MPAGGPRVAPRGGGGGRRDRAARFARGERHLLCEFSSQGRAALASLAAYQLPQNAMRAATVLGDRTAAAALRTLMYDQLPVMAAAAGGLAGLKRTRIE